MRKLLGTGVGFAAMLVIACDGGPKAGEIVMELVNPDQPLGALVFTVTSAESFTVDSVTSTCVGCQLFTLRRSERDVRAVITGQLAVGPLIRVAVSDVKTPGAYGAVVIEAAARDFQLVSLTRIRLEIPQQ